MKEVRGYKVFKPDWTCRGFQYEVGRTFEKDIEPVCCDRGFHFCLELKDCFNYYSFNPDNKVAEVIAHGDICEEMGKCCTNKLEIVREITWQEALEMVNLGKSCTGLCNSGDCNSGDCNSTNFSSGCFNTEEEKIRLFNKPSDWTYKDWLNSDARRCLNGMQRDVVKWICERDMTKEEKEANPTYVTTGGYLKVLDESECPQAWWDGLSEEDRNVVQSIPNFDAEIFQKITGIKMKD